MPRIIFLNRYFFPDHSATSQILSELAFHLAATGMDVSVVTSRQRYDDPGAQLDASEHVKGVEVHRVKTSRFGRAGILGRSIDYASFYGSAFRKVKEISRPGDVLVAKTDPPLLSILGSRLQRSNQLILVNWLQDLYPEVARELGVPFVTGPVYSSLVAARNTSLRAAAMNVAIGETMAERIKAAGVDARRVTVIPNWANEEDIVPVARAANRLIEAWGLEGKFVVGYSGNLGRAHEFDTVLRAAKLLKSEPDIVFLVVGGGKKVAALKAQALELGLADSFRFQPYQPESLLAHSLGAVDVHWISLLPELEGLIVPSKFFGIAAAGRPMIFVGSDQGELAAIIRREVIGFTVAPGDGQSLARHVLDLKASPPLQEGMGRRARELSEGSFNRRRALNAWSDLLQRLTQARDV